MLFTGVFTKKAGQVSEGLACFWNPLKFRMVENDRHVVHETLDDFPELKAGFTFLH